MIESTTKAPIIQSAENKKEIKDPTWVKVQDILKRIFSSPLFWASLKICLLTTFTITAIACPALIPIKILLPVVGIGLATLGIEIYLLYKPLAYELILSWNILVNAIRPESKPWWNSITDKIVLGAIPLKNKKHIDKIKEEGISTVVSLLELFEFKDKIFSVPAKTADWSAKKITHKHVAAEDFLPVPLNKLDEAVEFMHKKISNGEKVFVHCKSGVGRSSMAVACYLLKYDPKHTDVAKTLAFIKYQRPQVHLNEKQLKQLELYKKTYCS